MALNMKRVTDLQEKTEVLDEDLFAVGNNGTPSLRKTKWSTIWNKIVEKFRTTLLVQNATTADTTRAASAAVAKNLQDQITELNTNKTISLSINDIASILSVTNLSACRNGGNVYVRIDVVTKEQFVGWTTILHGLPIPALPTYIQTPNAKIRVQDGALALSGAAKGTAIDTVISYPSIS